MYTHSTLKKLKLDSFSVTRARCAAPCHSPNRPAVFVATASRLGQGRVGRHRRLSCSTSSSATAAVPSPQPSCCHVARLPLPATKRSPSSCTATAAAASSPQPAPQPAAAPAAMRLLIALDGSAEGGAQQQLVRDVLCALPPSSSPPSLDLVTVLPPPSVTIAAPSPVVTAAALTSVLAAQEAQARADERRAREAVAAAAAAATAAGVPKERVKTHVLPAAGGASGVGESIVEYAAAAADGGFGLVAVGSRGLGGLKRSLMTLVGLGSVSDYCAHHVAAPVLVCEHHHHQAAKTAEAAGAAGPEPPAPAPRVVVVPVDDSPHSARALDWALAHAIGPRDALHVVSVALPVPYPLLDETAAGAAAALEAQEWAHGSERNLAYAKELAERAAAGAVKSGKVPSDRVTRAWLEPAGGASDVGAAIAAYARDHKAALVVAGARGMGGVKRSLMGFVGLGSVSDYLLHQLAGGGVAPVVVVKPAPEHAAAAAAPHAEGAAAAAVRATPQPPTTPPTAAKEE